MTSDEQRPRGGAEETLVVGGGLVGMACALGLQQTGRVCTLIDPGCEREAASYGNAGHLAIEQVSPLASRQMLRSLPRRWYGRGGPVDVPRPLAIAPWLLKFLASTAPARHAAGREALRGLLADAIPAWKRVCALTGTAALLREDGHVVLWESDAAAKRGRSEWLSADIGQATVAPLSTDALQGYATHLSRPMRDGLRFAGSGQITDLGALLDGMRQAFLAAGGQVLQAKAIALTTQGGRAGVALTGGHVINAGNVLIAAGVGSAALMASAGIRTPLIAERGYHLHWRDHAWPGDSPPVVFEDRSVILTRFDNGLRLAGFVEFSPPGLPPDPHKWRRLRDHARELGLPVTGEGEEWMGARPTLPDYLPAIGRCRGIDNLYYAFGHQHLGLTLAAVTAERVASMIGQGTTAALEAFDLERFG